MDAIAVRSFNRQLADIGMVARFETPDALRIGGASGGISGALARIVGIIYAEMQTGRWVRLKVCARDVCRWAFYDHSRNRTGTWCSMAVCGARVKASTYYRRRQSRASALRSS
jgi:predicted RNA-binding Zn ribbon-like protein